MDDDMHDDTPVSAREALLEAGLRLLSHAGAAELMPGVRAVCRRAGVQTGAFYRCFEDATDYHLALVQWIHDRDESLDVTEAAQRGMEDAAEWIADAAPDGRAIANVLARLAAQNVNALIERDDSFRIQLVLSATAHGNGDIARLIRSNFCSLNREREEHREVGYRQVFEALGLSIRSPFDLDSVSILIQAVIEGLLLRSLVDKDLDVATLTEDAIRVLAVALLVTDEEDAEDLDEVFDRTLDGARRRRSPHAAVA